MPQEFHVLQCFSCSTFQVHQVKKSSNKWNCKLCGEKQSIKKVYGRGSGSDCRHHVQRLNTLRQELDTVHTLSICGGDPPAEESPERRGFTHTSQETDTKNIDGFPGGTDSKWSQYVEEDLVDSHNGTTEPEDVLYTTDSNVFNRSRKRKRETSNTNRKIVRHQYDLDADSKSPTSCYAKTIQYNQPLTNVTTSLSSVQTFHQPQTDMFQSSSARNAGRTKSSFQQFPNDSHSTSSFSSVNQHASLKDASGTINFKQNYDRSKIVPMKVLETNASQTNPTVDKLKGSKWDQNHMDSTVGNNKGSKWDQFIEEDQDTPEDSEDEQENLSPFSPISDKQNNCLPQRNSAPLPKTGNKTNQGLFSIDDLEDSDFIL